MRSKVALLTGSVLAVLLVSLFMGCMSTPTFETTPAPETEPSPEAQPASEPTPSQSSMDSATYTSSEYGFSFEYPKDWDVMEDYMGCTCVLYGPLVREGYMVAISLNAESLTGFPTEVTFDDYWRMVELNSKRSDPTYEGIDKYDTIVGGEPAKLILCSTCYEFEGETIDLKDAYVAFVKDDTGYVITYDIPVEFHDQYYDSFELVLKTIRFD